MPPGAVGGSESSELHAARPADVFRAALDLAVASLRGLVGRDWSVPAGTLEWSCSQTMEHLVDVIFSYAFQLASGAEGGFLPFEPLRASPRATPDDLLRGLRGAGEILAAVLRSVPLEASASDGVLQLGVADWAARGAYEVVVHTHDVLAGLAVAFEPPAPMCAWVLASPTLWMIDRESAAAAADPWAALLLGSGRQASEIRPGPT